MERKFVCIAGTLIVSALLAALILPSLLGVKPDGNARVEGADTPQSLVATYRRALATKDWRTCFLCYDPKMRGDFLIRTFYATAVSRDAELAAIIKKRLRIEFTDPERMPLPGLRRDNRVPKEILFFEAIQKQVDDLPRFVDEMCQRFDAVGQETFTQFGDVREISVQGDKAIGYWTPPAVKIAGAAKSKASSAPGNQEQSLASNREPIQFRKMGGKWYITITDLPPPLSVD